MGAAIGGSLPLAVGVLFSPMPLVAMTLMLGSRRAGANGIAFLLGWVAGILAVGAVGLWVAGAAGAAGPDGSPTWAGWIKIGLGALLVGVAARTWLGRPQGDTVAPAPRWMQVVDSFDAVKAFGLAAVFGAVNPKNLLLVLSAAAGIATATDSVGARFAALAVFTGVASLAVAALLVTYLVAGPGAATVLERLKTSMVAHNALIMALLLVVLGVKMVGDGISAV